MPSGVYHIERFAVYDEDVDQQERERHEHDEEECLLTGTAGPDTHDHHHDGKCYHDDGDECDANKKGSWCDYMPPSSPMLRSKYAPKGSYMDDLSKDDADIEDERERTCFELTDYEHIPTFLKGNEYLLFGYRVNFSWALCVTSIFKRHNETLNIWTHLLGTILFIVLALFVLVGGYGLEGAVLEDKLVFSVFFVAAICQMAFSTIFHTFNCHSNRLYLWFARLDYTGITMMIVGSYFPCIFYTMRCHPNLVTIHLSLISVLGVVGIFITCVPIFSSPKYRVMRVAFFVLLGLYVLIPLPHILVLYGFQSFWPLLWRLLIMGSLYIAGAVVYATRAPECCRPGRFDYSWYSHPEGA